MSANAGQGHVPIVEKTPLDDVDLGWQVARDL